MPHMLSEAEVSMRLLDRPLDALTDEERRVIAAIVSRAPSSKNADDLAAEQEDFADRLADRVASIGGSWGFIIAFSLVLFGWMLLNSKALASWGITFDPFPFIFLNLVLSTLAAVQAPVIMMSQNRQAAKDRLSAQLDYEVNLRAELEIMGLHHKLDQMPILMIADRLDAIQKQLDQLAKRVGN